MEERYELRRDMPQRNGEEEDKQPRLSFSPAASVWGPIGRAWTTGKHNMSRTTETITVEEYVACFHQYFGFTNIPVLAPFAQERCRCQRYLVGGDCGRDHVNCCLFHARNWYCAHNHVLRALEGDVKTPVSPPPSRRSSRVRATAGWISKSSTSAWQQTDLLVDVTLRHDLFHGRQA
jgi:hypothetical protein